MPNSYVPADDKLLVKSVRLESPGEWEFIGKINPLEVIRQYIKDRHERRQDKEYRESAEKEKLELENSLTRTELYGKQIKLLREMGATEADLALLKNRLLHDPLASLDHANTTQFVLASNGPSTHDPIYMKVRSPNE